MKKLKSMLVGLLVTFAVLLPLSSFAADPFSLLGRTRNEYLEAVVPTYGNAAEAGGDYETYYVIHKLVYEGRNVTLKAVFYNDVLSSVVVGLEYVSDELMSEDFPAVSDYFVDTYIGTKETQWKFYPSEYYGIMHTTLDGYLYSLWLQVKQFDKYWHIYLIKEVP